MSKDVLLRRLATAAALLLVTGTAASAGTTGGGVTPPTIDPGFTNWTAFVIRGATAGGAAPTIFADATAGTVEFDIAQAGQKAALGTNLLNNTKLSQISKLFIDRTDDTSRYTAGSGAACAPYMNFWITDPTHTKFAVLANEPTNPEWATSPGGMSQWNTDWANLSSKTAMVYESSDQSWLKNGSSSNFGTFADYTILAPTSAYWTSGSAGTGAPRKIGTETAFGFNWVFGDTLSNFVSGQPGYVVKGPVANFTAPVPEPAFYQMAALLGLAGLGALRMRRRRA